MCSRLLWWLLLLLDARPWLDLLHPGEGALELRRGAAHQHDIGALVGETQRNRLANAACGARDDGCFAEQ